MTDFTIFLHEKMKVAPVPLEFSPEDRENLLALRASMTKAMGSEKLRQFLVWELNGWIKEYGDQDLLEKWGPLL